MGKRKIFVLAIVGIALIAGIAAAAHASTAKRTLAEKEAIIEKAFHEMKSKKDRVSGYVAEGPDIKITQERFLFYKANLELQNELHPATSSLMTDGEMLDVLIKKELAVLDAIKRGIAVTESEIEEAIRYQRDTLEHATGEDGEFVQDLMKNRIRMTGMSEDQFWTSELIKDEYRKSIYLGKIFTALKSEGQIHDMKGFAKYEDDLLQSQRETLVINLSN
ncbi:hypothetical protein D3P08_17190 [Paenibacillus nanensis]|uniref:Uncharacterized protein n=1 Tax=Paenibacillus nanensis TaxID=393251 RepID=A0A3A1UUU3_9BACL|nr:SurA N-terminal domain-containing protein [Paenibacillus nanensis]RIX51211.1 hypothetical protein D3P08_17190 [Paenibacillus nanensis]